MSSKSNKLTLFDVLCLGVNAIVGSGIYAFPGLLAGLLGPLSFAAFGVCGAVAALVGLCFAEAAGMFERSGGPLLYAKAALGRPLGYLVGWTCWTAALLSWAAVARAVPPYLGHLWPPLATSGGTVAVAAGLVLVLGAINLAGVRPGALTMDGFTVAKLLPLLLLTALGLRRLQPARLRPLAPHGLSPLPRAAFTAFFAFQGFEVVPVPAGETSAPRRNAPLAVLLSLGASTVLYMLIQLTAVGTTPGLTGSKEPLALMGQTLLGAAGGQLVAAAAVVSMVGFCAGVALAGPRYLEALALEGYLHPRLAARHARWGTPHLAIVLTTGLTALLSGLLEFSRLVDLSVLTVSVQYLATCLAVPLLRHQQPTLPRSFRLPAGPLIPLAAVAVTLWLTAQATPQALLLFLLIQLAGLLPLLLGPKRSTP